MSDLEVSPPSIMYFVVFSSKTAFFKLQDIFPECFYYRDQSPQIEPLICLREENACTVGKNCMDILCRRLYAMFEEICTDCDLILLYFRKRNFDGLGAGVFWSSLEEPRLITMNPSGWERIKRHGNFYRFNPHHEFFLTGNAPPPEKSEDQMLD